MFFLYHHHDLDRLAALLAVLRQRDGGSPLAPDTVLVANDGVGRWLKMALAERDGIAANIETPLPARYVWSLLAGSFPEGRVDSAAYERGHLRWYLYALLPAIAGEVPAVAHYLDGEPIGELRRLQLADRLADVFDQYLIYRRDMLVAWEGGRGENRPPADWQAPVWRALVARLGPYHRAWLLGEFVHRLESQGPLERGHWPRSLFCFGLADLPPDYLRLLYALGRERDVHFMLHNPSDVYWGDVQRRPVSLALDPGSEPIPGEPEIDDGHPLLATLGYGGRDFLRLLYSDELAGILEPELGEAMRYEPPEPDTLLHGIQAGVIRMDARPDPAMAGADASLQVHACHGPLREVQVLHDQLLDLMSADASLEAREMLVMVPDMTRFAPAIHAVFGGAEGKLRIPYNVADQPRRTLHPVCRIFRELLELPLARWTASEVMAIAAVPAVMRRFGLDAIAIDDLRNWISEAGVRWGLDAATREAAEAGHWEQNTWRFGLDRLLLGVAQSDASSLIDGVAPWAELEGGRTEAVGRLWRLLERLRIWRDTLVQPASGAAWQARLHAMLEDLLCPDPEDRDEQAALAAVSEAVAELGRAGQCLGETPVHWDAVREVLAGELDATGERQPFLAGGVTFCGLLPLRAVPFRVICLLGMDEAGFPGQDRQRGFNLVRRFPRLGDRSRRADDRLLFLQALLAARDVFYVSYTGRDVHSGEELEPSAVVAELLDFVAVWHLPEGTPGVAAKDRLVTRQPMQPFSPRYFRRDTRSSRVFTFRGAWRPGIEALHGERTEAAGLVDGTQAPDPGIREVELGALQQFWRHPSRHFFREVLGLDLERAMVDRVEDEEPRVPDNLAQHRLRESLFARACEGGGCREDLHAWLRAQGALPPPPLDLEPQQSLIDEVDTLLPLWRRWHGEAQAGEWVDVDLVLPCGVRFTGWIDDVRPEGLRRMRIGRLRMAQQLGYWMELLALRAAGHGGELQCAGLDGHSELVVLSGGIEPEAALAHLDALVAGYCEGQRAPLCFMSDLAERYIEDVQPRWGTTAVSPDKALEGRNGYLRQTYHPAWELTRDAYFAHVAAPPGRLGATAASSDFCRLVTMACGPIAKYLLPVDAPVL